MLPRASAGAVTAAPRSALTARTGWRRLIVLGANPRHPWIWTALAVAAAAALTIARRPESVFHAQFWAEDGQVWFAEAYTRGWLASLLTPHTGYFQTISRLTADISLLFDFKLAPLIFSTLAVALQVLPAAFFLTSRFQRVVPDYRLRVLIAFLYVALPNSFEVDANITNAMTHLALLGVLIILACPKVRTEWRLFDVFFLTLSGLSGPFVIALSPIAVIRWFTDRKSRWRLVITLVTLACAATQAGAYLLTGASGRPHVPLGATPHGLMAIVAGNVFLGAVVGLNKYIQIYGQPWWEPHSIALRLVFLGGMGMVIYAFVRGPLELRLYTLFAWMVLGASMLTPVLSLSGDQWPQLAQPGAGDRYYILAMVSVLVSVVWIAFRSGIWPLRIAALAVVLGTAGIGVPNDWTYPPYTDLHPERYAQAFDAAPVGSRVEVPINPPGWEIRVTKK